jgi:hypothetical protein
VIYAIAEVGDECGPVKLGYAKGEPWQGRWEHQLRHRLRDIQMGNPRELEVVALCSGTMQQEHALHALFSQYRARNEWFYRVGDVLDFVCAHSIESIRGSMIKTRKRGLAELVQDGASSARLKSIIGRAWSQIGLEQRRAVQARRLRRVFCSACGGQGHSRATCQEPVAVQIVSP